jgi:hypothetical protein
MSTPRAGGSVASVSRLSSKKAQATDFSDASVQAFKDIAETMKEKHSTDKMFRLLAMDGVSPNTKKSIQEALLNDFRKEHGTASKRQKTTTPDDVVHHVDEYRNMSHIHRPIVAEDFVCGTTVDSSQDDPCVDDGDIDDKTSITKDPDAEAETIL